MEKYCKITADNQAMAMPNPFRLVISNPTEEQKKMLAKLDGWLEKIETAEPTYDADTQYLTCHYEEQNGKANQVWKINDIESDEQ